MIASPQTDSYSDTGLDPTTTYYYYVTAVDTSDNEGTASDEASGITLESDTTPPSQVTGLTVTTTGPDQLDLSWDANTESDLDHYNVYRSLSSGSGFSLTASTTTNSYSDTGLESSITYYYKVTAVDTSDNEGAASAEASGTTEEGISGEGYKLSKNASFSTEDRDYSMADTIYMKIWSDRVDYDNLNKAEYEVKVEGIRIKGVLTYSPDGSFTASTEMSQFPQTGSGTVKLKLEDVNKVKYEVRNIPITLTD
jgi:hypothetical protein